jgi:hypothetical protein
MNEQIEDERGLMSKEDFKKMLYTAFGRIPNEKKEKIYSMIIPLVQVCDSNVSIAQLSQFIDFYNYVPLMMNSVKHKNETSADLGVFMGKNSREVS